MWKRNKLIILLKSTKTHTVKQALEKKKDKGMIVRHDIDWCLEDAYDFFLQEKDHGINSTYYVRVSSSVYNVNASKNKKILSDISKFNEVGLHFDKSIYEKKKISIGFKNELEQLSNIIGKKIYTFSDHVPSKHGMFKENIKNIKSAYSKKIFDPKTYISDSRYEYKKNFSKFLKLSNKRLVYFLSHPEYYITDVRSYKLIMKRLEKLFIDQLKKEISYNNPNFNKF